MQCLLDGHSLQCAFSKGLQRRAIGTFDSGDRENPRILPEVKRVLHDVPLDRSRLSVPAASSVLKESASMAARRRAVRCQAASENCVILRRPPSIGRGNDAPVPAAAHCQAVARDQCIRQICLRPARGLHHAEARQQSRDGGRECATGSMRVARCDATAGSAVIVVPSNSRSVLSLPPRWPPFSNTHCDPSRYRSRTVCCMAASVAGAVSPIRTSASGRFGVMT